MNSQNSYKYINIFIYIFFIVLFFLQGLSTSEAKRQACAVCLSFCQGKAEKCDAIPFSNILHKNIKSTQKSVDTLRAGVYTRSNKRVGGRGGQRI